MTLIVTVAAQDWALQVSDRQTTQPDGRVHSDETNKAIVFGRHLGFAHTGVACIRSQTAWISTAEWVAARMRESMTTADMPFVVKNALENAWRLEYGEAGPLLLLQGVGFMQLANAQTGAVCPLQTAIVDIDNRTGRFAASLRKRRPDETPSAALIEVSGSPPDEAESMQLLAVLESKVEDGAGAGDVLPIVVNAFRERAAVPGSAVGRTMHAIVFDRETRFTGGEFTLILEDGVQRPALVIEALPQVHF